jgi:hypothetical protein
VRITALDLRQKALRGKSHEHFKHEIRLKVIGSDERHDGNQTMKVLAAVTAVTAHWKFTIAKVL